jgi:hypothetical protein
MSGILLNPYVFGGAAPPPPPALAIADFALYVNATASTSHPVALPSLVPGQILLCFIRWGGTTLTPTTPSGWTQVVLHSSSGTHAVYAKIATGSEGASVTISTTASVQVTAVTYAIAGADFAKVVGAATSGTSSNPPLVNASWGSQEHIAFAMASNRNGTRTITTVPAGYSNLRTARTNTADTSGSATNVATLQGVMASADPASFSWNLTASAAHATTVIVGAL